MFSKYAFFLRFRAISYNLWYNLSAHFIASAPWQKGKVMTEQEARAVVNALTAREKAILLSLLKSLAQKRPPLPTPPASDRKVV